MADFGHDAVTLAELQAQLLGAELKDALQSVRGPVVVMAAAGILALGMVPVLLAGVALLWDQYTSLSLGLTSLLTGLGALVLAGIGAWAGWRKLTGAVSLEQSRRELGRNVQWMKAVLKSGR